MVTGQNILDADMSRKTTRKKGKREKKTIVRTAEQSAAEKKKKKKLLSVQQRRRRMGRDMGVGPNRIEHWVVGARRWLEAWNGCHVRGTRIIMRISSKLVVHDTIWWDHEAWSRSRVLRWCGRYVCVVVPAQGDRGRQNIGRLPRRALSPNIDDGVLCHWHILRHPRRWKIWNLLSGSPSPPTARLPG
jgi:hypothetical protein